MRACRSLFVISTFFVLIFGSSPGFTAEEILPLPGISTRPSIATGEELIPLPGRQISNESQSTSLTPIEIPGIPARPENFPEPSPEIVIDPLSPGNPHPAPTSTNTSNTGTVPTGTTPGSPATHYPLMPKDTSSAIFMVMKTWECQDYDLKTLIEHAATVYGQEAEDKFEVKGLAELTPVTTSVKEEDVTLDELLDVVTRKHGLDWGVDVTQKIIYIYPGPKP